MYAFSVSPFPLKQCPKALSSISTQTLALRNTRFRAVSLRVATPCYQNLHSYHHIQTPRCFSEPPDHGEDDEEEDEEAEIVLTDPRTNRTLSAGVEHEVTSKGKTYLLCYPMDDPVTFARTSENGVLDPVDDDVLVQKMFPTAEAVLAEDHVVLKNSAYFMTVDDHSEDIGTSDDDDDDEEDDEDGEQQQEGDEQDVEVIGEFLHEGVPHFVVRPMDSILLVAEALENGYYRVLEDEDLESVSPVIEEFIENLDVATA